MLLLMIEWHWSTWGNLLRGKSSGIKITGIKLMRCKIGEIPKFGSNFYYDFEVSEMDRKGAFINVSVSNHHYEKIRLERFRMKRFRPHTRDSGWIFRFLLI